MASSHKTSQFDPDWCIRPGETLREWREENRLGIKSAATCCAMTADEFERVETGKRKITRVIACKLQQGTSIPATLWLNLERIYRDGLAAGRTDVSDA